VFWVKATQPLEEINEHLPKELSEVGEYNTLAGFILHQLEDIPEENQGKVFTTNSKYLLFINTKTGDTNQVNFPKDAGIGSIQQIKIDSLNINLILVSGRTVDLDGKSGIDWNDPTQIIILSPDGKTKTQLTDSKFFVRAWTINNMSGTIVVAGHYDTNNNNRYDKKDKDEIHIYDLKTLKLITKI
jgi:hypothetical protein